MFLVLSAWHVWLWLFLAPTLEELSMCNSNSLTNSLRQIFALAVLSPYIYAKSTWMFMKLQTLAFVVPTGWSRSSWPSPLFYQCPLKLSGASLEPSIFLYLCQINLDLYETWNLSFWGPNWLIQFILPIPHVLSVPCGTLYEPPTALFCLYFCQSRSYRPLVLFLNKTNIFFKTFENL